MILYLLFILILVVFIVGLGVEFFNIIFRGYAPFISTQSKVINKIFSEFTLTKDFSGSVYELGCGKAGFLKTFHDYYPQAKLIGIEYSLLPFFITKIQQSLNPKTKINIIRKNMFKVDLKEADVIYCFLDIYMMEKLEQKFKTECKPGTLIISYCFSMPTLKPFKTATNENRSRIYFYKI